MSLSERRRRRLAAGSWLLSAAAAGARCSRLLWSPRSLLLLLPALLVWQPPLLMLRSWRCCARGRRCRATCFAAAAAAGSATARGAVRSATAAAAADARAARAALLVRTGCPLHLLLHLGRDVRLVGLLEALHTRCGQDPGQSGAADRAAHFKHDLLCLHLSSWLAGYPAA